MEKVSSGNPDFIWNFPIRFTSQPFVFKNIGFISTDAVAGFYLGWFDVTTSTARTVQYFAFDYEVGFAIGY